jgi:hypothetical protein
VSATDDYMQLEAEQRKPKSLRDWTTLWNGLPLLADTNGATRANVEAFAASKRVAVASLEALGARLKLRDGGRIELAFAGSNGNGAIVAVKYRPLAGTSHDCYAENPSTWLRPIIVGNRDSLHWFLAEGETDGARLHGLIGEHAAVLILPSGALTFQKEWAAVVPRGATAYTCHDADDAGDKGAAKVARFLSKTVRVRPPVEGGDWCDWQGGRDEFVQLVEAARDAVEAERPFSMTLREFVALDRPAVQPLIVDTDGRPVIAQHSLTLLGALGGAGKTTLFVELALHLAAGVDYLNFSIPEPASVLLIENEGPEEMFALKLEEKLKTFPHPLKARVSVCTLDWGGFTLGDDQMRQRLREELAEHEYDLVFGDPLDSLGIQGVGSPEDTRKFFKLMKETGLHKTVAWWLNTHPRKEETKEALNEISGAWGGKPDAVLLLTMLSDDRSRVRFPKLRWAKRGKRPAILLAFDVDTETFTFLTEEVDEERDYLAEIVALLADGEWRTPKEIAAKKEADEPGIGAADATVKKLLETHPDTFESRTGDEAKRLGRHPSATLWQLIQEAA